MLPISHVISQLINMLLTYLVVIAVLIVSGKGINVAIWIYFPVVVFQEVLLAFGLTMLCSAINVYFRDLQYILNIVVLAWQFMSPVMYAADQVPEKWRTLFYLNPMTPIIEAYRDIFYYKQSPQMSDFILGALMGCIMLLVGWISFDKLKKHFAEVM